MTLNTLRMRLQKYAQYTRTKRELRAMPLETAIDLGMFREDAGRTAAQAVYG